MRPRQQPAHRTCLHTANIGAGDVHPDQTSPARVSTKTVRAVILHGPRNAPLERRLRRGILQSVFVLLVRRLRPTAPMVYIAAPDTTTQNTPKPTPVNASEDVDDGANAPVVDAFEVLMVEEPSPFAAEPQGAVVVVVVGAVVVVDVVDVVDVGAVEVVVDVDAVVDVVVVVVGAVVDVGVVVDVDVDGTVVVVEPVGPVVLVVDVGTDDVVVVLAGVVEVDEVHCVVDVVEGVELVVVVVVGELVEGLVEVEVLDVLVAAALTGVSDCAVVTKLPNAGISGSTTSSKFPVRDGTRSLVASVDRKAKSCPTTVVPA